mgnify:CR=1 FL=1
MQILNISKLRNGIGILKKQENITENLTAEENRKEITETIENAAAEKKPADRHERMQQPQRRKQTRQQGKKKKAERLKRKPEQRRKQKVRLQRL